LLAGYSTVASFGLKKRTGARYERITTTKANKNQLTSLSPKTIAKELPTKYAKRTAISVFETGGLTVLFLTPKKYATVEVADRIIEVTKTLIIKLTLTALNLVELRYVTTAVTINIATPNIREDFCIIPFTC
jgi:hypothetical protein